MIDVPVFLNTRTTNSNKKELIIQYKDDYLAGKITQRGISEKTGAPIGTVSNVLHANKIKRRSTPMIRRLKSLLWFYEMGMYSAKDLAKILNTSLSSVTSSLFVLNAKKKNLVNRVNELMGRGFTFDAAIKFTGCDMDSYTDGLKREAER